MNITLNKDEVQAAIAAFIGAQGITLRNKSVTIVSDEDVKIEVSIDDADAAPRKKHSIKKSAKKQAEKTIVTEEPVAPEHQAEDEAADAEVEEKAVDDIAAEMEGKKPSIKKAPAHSRMFGAKKS